MCSLRVWNILYWRNSHFMHMYHFTLLFIGLTIYIACPASCTTCTSSSVCTNCAPNHFYNSASASCQACISGTFSDGGTVTSCSSKILYFSSSHFPFIGCPPECADCDSTGTCTNCVANYYYESEFSSCIAVPDGTYSEGGNSTEYKGNKLSLLSLLILRKIVFLPVKLV